MSSISKGTNSQVLAQVPLFASLPAAEIERLATSLHTLEIAPATMLFSEGDTGNHFYVVLDGEIEVVKALGTPDERLIAVRRAGEFVGEMSLFSQEGLRTASVRARRQARLLEMTRDDFDALLHRHPMMAYEMVRVMGGRLGAAHDAAIHDLQEKNQRLSEAYEALKAAQAQIIEKERLERELKVAHDIQMSILPRALPQLSGFDFGARLVPARAVGGDLYDFIPLGDNQLGVVIGDVTDKGVPAAIFMAQAHALLRAEASQSTSPREALQRANTHLLQMNARGLFVTVLYGVVNRVTRTFTYARAGHELPLLCSADGAISSPPEGISLPLGIFIDPPLDEQTVALSPGTLVLLYTDGVTDARNAQREDYGIEKLRAVLQCSAETTAQATCDALLQDVINHFGAAPQHDDVAVVALRAVPVRGTAN